MSPWNGRWLVSHIFYGIHLGYKNKAHKSILRLTGKTSERTFLPKRYVSDHVHVNIANIISYKENLNETTKRFHFISARLIITKTCIINTSVRKNTEELEPSCITGKDVN